MQEIMRGMFETHPLKSLPVEHNFSTKPDYFEMGALIDYVFYYFVVCWYYFIL
jgi:hypothetical protein